MGITGCGPTVVSMSAVYLTKNDKFTPDHVAHVSEKNGYYVNGIGTSWKFIEDGCELFDIHSKEIKLTEQSLKEELSRQYPIIASVGPGNFTGTGHFIVIAGFNDSGFLVNDPNSLKNSSKYWSFDTLKKQIKKLWAMYV